jgi:Zn-dependent metalloprotease
MKKTIFTLVLLGCSVLAGAQNTMAGWAEEIVRDAQGAPVYIRLKGGNNISRESVQAFILRELISDKEYSLSPFRTETDGFGFTHIRYNVLYRGTRIADRVVIAHLRHGRLESVNGDLSPAGHPSNDRMLSEQAALKAALKKVGAKRYRWQNEAETRHMREVLNDPAFTYYPHGEEVIVRKSDRCYYAWRFNIYAEEPLYRANVYVDAATGKVISEENLLCEINVPGTAITKYSGTQTITCDQTGGVYSLKETQRGLGVETYNMNNTTSYAANNFTNGSASWTSTGFDQGATDAHWGAETTYDYYLSQHNRNSINNAGFKLLSYVHYSTNYNNAFWDGQRMTYGDGNGTSYKIFTALDVCGHEVTHGLTSNSAQLNYSYESGALNESFSDIFGTAIENYGRPGNWNWKMGEDLTTSGNGLRNMSSPNLYSDPDTYMGQYWYTGTGDNGGVHTNSGVSNYWFYLLVTGGTGVNDISNSYSVSAIGMNSAARIAFRALTVYFTPTTNYYNARQLTIQAARDIFGSCSNEVIQTANAWHAVGVGPVLSLNTVGPNFTAPATSFCALPATISFSNSTIFGLSYSWDFGDGATSTSISPVHTYTAPGVYTVKLKATGCTATDSVIKNAYISIVLPSNPAVTGATVCGSGTALLTSTANGSLRWYDSPTSPFVVNTGSSFATPGLSSTTTYYVANTFTSNPVFGGKPVANGGGFLSNAAQWQVFDVIQNCVLNTVDVLAQTAGVRSIQLRSATNAILNTTTVNLVVGVNTVTLNYSLSPGTGFRLGLGTSVADLYRSNSGITYPYNIGGIVNITSSSAGSGYYYWYYNWKVTKDECASSRVPVTVTVNPLPVVTITASAPGVCADGAIFLSADPVGGTFSGNGVNGSVFIAASAGPGPHVVQYAYSDGNGCSSTASLSLLVDACTGIAETMSSSALMVYPNPASAQVKIITASPGCSLRVTDVRGRIIIEQKMTGTQSELDVASFSAGLYFIDVRTPGGVSSVVKLVKE